MNIVAQWRIKSSIHQPDPTIEAPRRFAKRRPLKPRSQRRPSALQPTRLQATTLACRSLEAGIDELTPLSFLEFAAPGGAIGKATVYEIVIALLLATAGARQNAPPERPD